MFVTLFAAATLSFQVSQAAEPTPTPAPAARESAAPAEDENRTVCRRERNVGSNFPVRVCRTEREWREMRDSAEELARRNEGRGAPQQLDGM